MRKKPILIALALPMLCAFSLALAATENYKTGFVDKISESNIDLRFWPYGHVDYSLTDSNCAPEACLALQRIQVGDEVLLTLGAAEGKTQLLSIRKCLADDAVCKSISVAQIQKKASKLLQKSDFYSEEGKSCIAQMSQELENGQHYFHFDEDITRSDFEKYQIKLKKYFKLTAPPHPNACLHDFIRAEENVSIAACEKFQCGKYDRHGCYGIGRLTLSTPFLDAAFKHCGL